MYLLKLPLPQGGVEPGMASPSVSVNAQNSKIAFSRLDGTVWTWDLKTLAKLVPNGKNKLEFTHLVEDKTEIKLGDDNQVTCVRYGNLHDRLAIGCASKAQVYIQDEELYLAYELEGATVTDLSWSAEDELLAIATLNHGIAIYDTTNKEVIATINESAKGIKGIAFDLNSGKNLVSLSDDRQTVIFQYTLTETPEGKRVFSHSVKESFDGLVSMSPLNKLKVRKLSWSRDNRVLTLPNASKGSQTALVSVMRNPENPPKQPKGSTAAGWKPFCNFAGHGFQCSVTAVSPLIYRNPDATPQQVENAGKDIVVNQCPTALNYRYSYIVATASIDATVAIWSTTSDSPLLVAEGVLQAGIVDMCWAKDGSQLFFTGRNGELFMMSFQEQELGEIADMSKTGVTTASRLASDLKSSLKESQKTTKVTAEPVKIEAPEPQVETIAPADKNNMITKTKNGKKRVAPVLLSGNGTNGEASNGKKNGESKTTMEFDQPSYAVGKDLPSKLNKLARPADEDIESDPKRHKKSVEPVEIIGSVVLNPSNAFSNVRISIPKVRSYIKQVSPTDESLELEVINGNGNESTPTRVTLMKTHMPFQSTEVERKQVFVDFLPKRVLLASGGEGDFWVVATVDGNVIVYSDVGRRLLPPIVLGSPLSFLETKGKYLLAVTSIGEMHIWDVPAKKSLFGSTSLFPLLQPVFRSNATDSSNNVYISGEYLSRAENLTMCSITAAGIPVVTLSNGNGYLYNKQMGTWSLISDSWWAFGSQYWDSTALGSDNRDKSSDIASTSENVVSLLERHTNEEVMRKGKGRLFSKISKIMLMKEGFENLEVVVSLNHLENKLLVYELLNDSANFKALFLVYMKRLSEIPLKARILEICAALYGPNDDKTPWEPKICGVEKRKLLEEVVFACSKYREVQRILVEYAEAIGIVT